MSDSEPLREAAVSSSSSSSSSTSCILPAVMHNENADFWLNDEEIQEIGKFARRERMIGGIIGLMVLAVWWFLPITVEPLHHILLLYLMAGLLIPSIGSYIAFGHSNARQLSRSRRCSQITRAISRYFVPFGPELASLCFGQIDAIVGSYQGRFVDGQVSLAESQACSKLLMHSGGLALSITQANLYARAGRFDLAEPKYQKCVELANKWTIKPFTRATAQNNLGWNYMLAGQSELAKKPLEEAARLLKSIITPDSRTERLSLTIDINLARTMVRLGEYDDAERLLEATFNKITRRFKHVEALLTETQIGLAELRICQNRFEEAQMHIESAVEGYKAISGSGTAESRHARQLKVLILKALGRDEESERLKLECEIEVDVMNSENLARMQQVRSVLTKRLAKH